MSVLNLEGGRQAHLFSVFQTAAAGAKAHPKAFLDENAQG